MPPSLAVLAPPVLLVTALFALVRPGRRPGALPRLAEVAGIVAFGLIGAGAAQMALLGPAAGTIGSGAFALTLRFDVLSAVIMLIVGFIGWVVVRYARSYLDGETREGAFHGLLLATLAAVLVLGMAGSLALLVASFIAVGLGIRRLLLFYPARPEARCAATKFALVWGGGDAALILATLLLWFAFGTADIAAINRAAAAGPVPASALVATGLLVLAALLKTAAFPVHGWLTEMMEAPTPVSALLHAGIINAGGVLLIRFADVMQTSPGAMAALVMLGGFTALAGGLVMLTQAAVKTALAWSTVAQMGFMLLQCGLGLWALALLHIVAHSLYKAHAFLGSGTAVRAVQSARRPGPVAVPGIGAVMRAFAIARAIYAAVAGGFWAVFGPKPAQAVALGAILIFGVAYLSAQGLADTAPRALTRRTTLASGAAALAYFAFHRLAEALTAGALPAPPAPGPLEGALLVLVILSFGAVAVAQALLPHWAHHPAAAGLRVHLANGLYLNAALERLIGGCRAARPL
ncbi:proton-conducting transporter transmembrane domain-containing protein [Neoroseomonas lacus]|uniref:Probable inorganic carbon transporter subunit DabB n=1 Tax=Neoroseomonas lacus TaxID=287609 RepID=A0A917L341_9PROT|nr:proton-conducting transporter membrane subunit [Neoroseomonas lacus]GGJ42432.1 NADH dehydrogenase [Neoroseomonas lacus]